ncbi:methyltransferase 24 [uncultured Candidatus Thioglobus sp.]|nr:methyltransferase 24 [uncultured Candidatus Thioglobus sp.]
MSFSAALLCTEQKEANMFENYPKNRPPLPKEIQDIYSKHYKSNREGQTTASSLAQKMESWLHKQVARDVVKQQDSEKVTLELGAGTLNQLRYEPKVRSYDIVEPFTELYNNSDFIQRIGNIYTDISEIPDSSRYDRITSVATLEHICNLPEVIARCGLLLAENGVLRASVPSEGTWLWALGWKMTTGLEFKIKYGVDYGLLMKHEHVNTAKEIEEVLEYFFKKVKCKVFGLSKSNSLYQYYECRVPEVDRCRNFLKNIGIRVDF